MYIQRLRVGGKQALLGSISFLFFSEGEGPRACSECAQPQEQREREREKARVDVNDSEF